MSEKDFRMELKRIFTGYQRITPCLLRELSDLGFSVKRRRNHVVLEILWQGENRSFVISNTASDHRAGRKIVCSIARSLYLQNA